MSDQDFNQPNKRRQPELARHSQHSRMVEPLISLYQDDEASPAERRTVEIYLAGCQECRVIYESYRQLETSLNAFLKDIPEPRFDDQAFSFLKTDRRPRIENTLPFIGQSGNPGRSGPIRQTGFRWASSLAGVAASLLLLVGLVVFLVIRTGSQPDLANPVGSSNPLTRVDQTTVITTADPTPSPTTSQPTPTVVITTAPATVTAPVVTTSAPSVMSSPPNQTTPAVAAQPTVAVGAATTAQPTQRSVTTTARSAGGAAVVPTVTPEPARPTVQPQPATPSEPPATAASPEVSAGATTAAVPSPTAPETTTAPPTVAAPANTTRAVPITTAAATTASQVQNGLARGTIAYVDKTDRQIHIVNADGSDDRLVTDQTANKDIVWEELVWSNDTRWIAAVGQNQVKGQRGIYLLDRQNPFKEEFITEGIQPVWSPDSRFLAYLDGPISLSNGLKQGHPAIYNLKKRLSKLISEELEGLAPQWFEGADRVLVGQNRIYQLDNDKLVQFQLPFTNTCIGNSLSPAGNKLAVLEQHDGKFDTVIYDLNRSQVNAKSLLLKTTAPVQGSIGLTCGAQRLRWTPDSKYVYYYTSNNPSFATCLINTTNGSARCLENVYNPSFSPDSTTLVDYSPASGLVYTAPASITARPPNPRWIAEARFAPVWQPR